MCVCNIERQTHTHTLTHSLSHTHRYYYFYYYYYYYYTPVATLLLLQLHVHSHRRIAARVYNLILQRVRRCWRTFLHIFVRETPGAMVAAKNDQKAILPLHMCHREGPLPPKKKFSPSVLDIIINQLILIITIVKCQRDGEGALPRILNVSARFSN